jgi:hypothetical protein
MLLIRRSEHDLALELTRPVLTHGLNTDPEVALNSGIDETTQRFNLISLYIFFRHQCIGTSLKKYIKVPKKG